MSADKLPRSCPGPNRRDFLRFGSVAVASTALGVTPFRAKASTSSNDPAVIFVWLPGGPPHQDTFDMKPDSPAEYRGPYKPIHTNVPGIDICEYLPKLATMADKYAIIRSIAHTFADHGGGHKKFLTGRDPMQPTGFINDYPMVGSMAAKMLAHKHAGVPNYIAGVDGGRQNIDTFSFGSSYLGPNTYPFTIVGDPSDKKFEIKNLSLLPGTEEKIADRLSLLEKINKPLVGDLTGNAATQDTFRQRALELVTKDTAKSAFDLTKEPAKLRERYGNHRYGQRALMARRLVEHGASWVTMVMENATPPGEQMVKNHTYNWDSHAVNCHIFEDTQFKLGFLDQAISALIEDLYARGLDKRVLLVVTGEFGRTPKIEYSKGTQTGVSQPGRDHWPSAMSILVSGGGMKMGQTIGSTTSKAETPKDRPMVPEDLWATVFNHLHIDYASTSFPDGTGRPMPMLPRGEPIKELV
ncbi:DUF1501 domain-containing protein [Limnoglobus roseus]|uniref:DUF1501 domain-containing protein n=1 Tax=Limnoglobus roseus TaxID=2598579 RepID=A0A5C1A6J1_9BACT|nr:DUF1501 domain-containing protein [Limnoglobus roseus]QEL13837.1 hypothetical protein PX52LOC_00695 [Limnoglobus roseus]